MYARPPRSRVSGSRMRSFRSIRCSRRSSVATGSLHGDDLEPAVRDVGERDEAVDPRRARGQDAARPGGHRDRVARVLALAARWQDDQRVRRRAVVELDQRRAGGSAAEQRAHDLPGEQRVEGALAGHGRACPRHREPDRAALRVAVERERPHDPHRCCGRGGQGQRGSEDDERSRHGGSLSDARRWRRLCA